MRPQRKPFVVEIKKTKQFCRKPASTKANRVDAVVQTGAKKAVDMAPWSEGRA